MLTVREQPSWKWMLETGWVISLNDGVA